MATRLTIGAGPIPEPEPGWTVQCVGVDKAHWCGLVVEGPLAGQRLPRFLPYASSTYCPQCYRVMLERLANRHKAS